jgi:hypothetical protein
MFAAGEPEELRRYLATPDASGIRFEGTTVPVLGAQPLVQLDSSLVVPALREDVASYAASYLTLPEYLDLSEDGVSFAPTSMIAPIADEQDRLELVAQTVRLNHYAGRPDALARLAEQYRDRWPPETQLRLDAALHNPDHRRVFLSKQPLLATIRHLLITDPVIPAEKRYPSIISAVILAHAMGGTLEADEANATRLGDMPAYLLLEVVRTALLGHTVDIEASLDRTVRLWREYGPRVTRGSLEETPLELLVEATGLDIIEILAFAFALLARRINGLGPEDAIFDRSDLGVRANPDKLLRFLDLTSDSWEGMRARLEESDRRFGFLAFEAKPILSTDAGLLVVDEDYLWQRVTTGLYWIVHDYLKFERAPGTDTNLRWNECYGEMVELYVEDALQVMTPRLLDGSSGTFYTEDDLERAYGATKKCDAAIFFGGALLMVEVIGGQMAVPTRIEGDPGQFAKDTDRLVIDKCRQLSESCEAVSADEMALTGFPPTPDLRFAPAVVVGGGYPVNPATRQYIRRQLGEERLFSSPVEPLSILDLEDIDMLEGLFERGHTPVDILRDWQASNLADLPFKSYVIRQFGGWGLSSRPTRMEEPVRETFEEIVGVLKEQDTNE